MTVDVADEAAVASAASATQADMGRVDILVNNAGISGPNRTTWDYEPAEWRKVIDVDLVGPFRAGAHPRDDRRQVRPHRQHRIGRGQGGQSERPPTARPRPA